MKILSLLITTAMSVSLASSQASVLIYNGFDYGAATALGTLAYNANGSTATGFDGSWGGGDFGGGANAWSTVTQNVTGSGVSNLVSGTFSSLPTAWTSTGFTPVGGYLTETDGSGNRFSLIELAPGSQMNMQPVSATSYYFSGLFRAGAVVDSTTLGLVNLGSGDGTGVNTGKLFFGQLGTVFANSSYTVTANTTYFVAGKLTLQTGSDVVQYKVFTGSDALDLSEPVTWTSSATVTQNTTGGTTLNILRMQFNNNGTPANSPSIDEIRFGTSWSDVVLAVPEPGVVGLALFGGMLLAMRRRTNRG